MELSGPALARTYFLCKFFLIKLLDVVAQIYKTEITVSIFRIFLVVKIFKQYYFKQCLSYSSCYMCCFYCDHNGDLVVIITVFTL